jgi:glucose/arabinose dehydrogenase
MIRRMSVLGFLLMTLAGSSMGQYSWQSAYPNLPTFSYPVELVSAHDGSNRMFVVQQRGIIYGFANDPLVATRKEFLNIADSVSPSGSETGLLGLAFHPRYSSNGYFYVNHTNTVGGQLRSYVARYQVSATNPDSADKSSRRVLMVIDQPYSNHNGGKIAFGPDGYLYIGFGDGGSGNDPGNRAQNRAELLGKILRINVDSIDAGYNYAIPPTNPYYRNGQGYKEEVFAYGIRNPWKFSFDAVTGALWLGDVGQDAREEVDVVVNGGNYGWRLMEGFLCTPGVNPGCLDTAGLIRPVWDYPNAGADIAVTGGYVYRSMTIPSLYGKYIFGDYGSGKTWALNNDGILPPSATLLSDEANSISSFGVDDSNRLMYCAYSTSGRIYKLTGPSSDVSGPSQSAPLNFVLGQNFPNPFNPSTVISYTLPRTMRIQLAVFNLLGQHVETLVDNVMERGLHRMTFDASGLPSGIYFYRLTAPGFTETRRMAVVR